MLAVKRMALTDVAATVLSSADYMVMPWKDGGGTTTEIAPWPPPESATSYPAQLSLGSDLACPSVAWRVSIADIAASCAFSRFEGYDRTLVLVRGSRMALHVGQQSAIDLAHYSRCTFEGEAPVRCTLFEGPVQDLNVMVARDRASEITEVLRPGIAMQRHAIHGTSLLLHCRGGAAVIGLDDDRAFDLKDGDTLRIDAATPSCGSFSIAAAVSTSPAVIAILITLLHQGERAMSDSVAAKAL